MSGDYETIKLKPKSHSRPQLILHIHIVTLKLVEMIFESYTQIKTAERSAALQKLKDEEYAQSIERFWASMGKSVSSRP